MNKTIIKLKNISKSFCECSILNDINLQLLESDTVGIIGASGTGKTTLMNIIGLLEYPDSGEIYWGKDSPLTLSKKSVNQVRGKIFGFVFQNHTLISELNVIDNILLPVKMHGNIKQSDLIFADNLLNRVGLLDHKFSKISTLSGGEKQRISIVRALINHPHVILADEPTGNLDENNANEVIHSMLDLCKFARTSLLLITHNNCLSKLMNRRYILSNGQLIQQQDEG